MSAISGTDPSKATVAPSATATTSSSLPRLQSRLARFQDLILIVQLTQSKTRKEELYLLTQDNYIQTTGPELTRDLPSNDDNVGPTT